MSNSQTKQNSARKGSSIGLAFIDEILGERALLTIPLIYGIQKKR